MELMTIVDSKRRKERISVKIPPVGSIYAPVREDTLRVSREDRSMRRGHEAQANPTVSSAQILEFFGIFFGIAGFVGVTCVAFFAGLSFGILWLSVAALVVSYLMVTGER